MRAQAGKGADRGLGSLVARVGRPQSKGAVQRLQESLAACGLQVLPLQERCCVLTSKGSVLFTALELAGL